MFVMTAKLTKKRAVLSIVGIGVAICALICIVATSKPVAPAPTPDPNAAEQPPVPTVKVTTAKITTNDERIKVLTDYGINVHPEPVEFMEVKLPKKFEDDMLTYRDIQLSQGFNLEKYAGKRVMRYSYKVTNYPNVQGDVLANLLFYKDKLIGGDIASTAGGGFIHGLLIPSATPAPTAPAQTPTPAPAPPPTPDATSPAPVTPSAVTEGPLDESDLTTAYEFAPEYPTE